MKLSIIIPVYNEEKTIAKVISRISNLILPKGFQKEVIVVDDGSSDNTPSEIKKNKTNFKYIRHEKNIGKGAAVISGIRESTGDYIVIQDADLEYNPEDIARLSTYITSDSDVIYGTRLARLPHLNKEERRTQFLAHYFGNRFLSFITSVFYGQWITDMETCYKIFPKNVVKDIKLNARGFEFEPEITAKLLKKGLKIKEVPIKTNPRGYDEGKKLNTFRDGFIALWSLIKYRFTS